MLRRQLLEGLAQTPVEFVTRGFRKGIATLAGQAAKFELAFLATKHRVAAFAAAEVDRQISGDPIEPGRETRTRFEFRKILIGANKGLLREFKRVILIMHHRHRNPHDAMLIALHQYPERLP